MKENYLDSLHGIFPATITTDGHRLMVFYPAEGDDMQSNLLKVLQCPKCKSSLTLTEEKHDDIEVISGILKCLSCNSTYRVENGMPLLYLDDENWVSKAREAKGWVDMHKSKGIYDQTGVGIDFTLPYFNEEPWIKVSQMFDTCLDMLNLDGTERILDMGAARGWAAKNFALKGCKVVATDIVPDDQIGLGRSKALIKNSNVYYDRIICDNENMPFIDNTFDVVFCAAVIHHTDNLQDLMKSVSRVLNVGGTFIAINEPCIGIFDDEKKHLIDSEELKYNINETRPNLIQYYNTLMNAGFNNIRIFHYSNYRKTSEEIEKLTKTYVIKEKINKIMSENQYLNETYPYNLMNLSLLEYGGELIMTAEKTNEIKKSPLIQRLVSKLTGSQTH
jgi:ubiquinone/menaquinone biosynthesis C-methylase UbiE/uncharacterized protein YbaR (Trm112 family)